MSAARLTVLALVLLSAPGCVFVACVDQLQHVSYPEQTACVVSSQLVGQRLTVQVAVEEQGGPARQVHTLVVDATGLAGPLELEETTHAAMRILLGPALFPEDWPRHFAVTGRDAAGVVLFREEVPALREEPGGGAKVAFVCLVPFAALLDLALFPIELPIQLLMWL